jgi:hypothetical protein
MHETTPLAYDSHGATNHDANGRCTPGNHAAIGHRHPFASQAAALRRAFYEAITAEDLHALARQLITQAHAGDLPPPSWSCCGVWANLASPWIPIAPCRQTSPPCRSPPPRGSPTGPQPLSPYRIRWASVGASRHSHCSERSARRSRRSDTTHRSTSPCLTCLTSSPQHTRAH